MTGPLEAQLGKVAVQAVARLARDRLDSRRFERLCEEARPLIPVRAAAALIEELSPEQVKRLDGFLDSPDFEQIAMRLLLAAALPGTKRTEPVLAVRAELRERLRHGLALDPGQQLGITDVVFDGLSVACRSVVESGGDLDTGVAAARGHVAAMAARNIRLLERIGDLAAAHRAADQLRQQVRALHAELRLPHTGTSRSVSWDRLYAPPELVAEPVDRWTPDLDRLMEPGRRTVLLGDPGAGKSTLAAWTAHRTAGAGDDRVPFLVVLRDVGDDLRRGGQALSELLVRLARDPYQVQLTLDQVEYLLGSGRAVVILDGLDELTDVALRRRVARVVEAFASRFPLAPMLVTSRRIGYLDAPLPSSLFRTAVIAAMDDERVRRYATSWFALDDSTPPADRDRLSAAFLRESQSISELRGNPLLLSLLCAMYATEQYIPRNRAQIYERCAVMVFERWDSMRGIPLPQRFQGYLRGAVQELAWQLFAIRDRSELPAPQVRRILGRYLEAKRFDADEAQALAEDFLAFCAGRAWVLDEVGMSDAEPLYGFAHRTFLEYFAAEYLVRHHPSAAATWAVLRPHLDDSGWAVVSQLGVQLLDRNVDDGAERLIELALSDDAPGVAAFLAGATGQVALSPGLIAPIVDAAYDRVCAVPVDRRHRFHTQINGHVYAAMQRADDPLWTVLHGSLDANLPFVHRAVRARLERQLRSDPRAARFLVDWVGAWSEQVDQRRVDHWEGLHDELLRTHAAELADDHPTHWPEVGRWNIDDADSVARHFDRRGPIGFYLTAQCFGMVTYPNAMSMLARRDSAGPRPASPAAGVLRDRLLAHPTPWLPAKDWSRDWADLGADDSLWELSQVAQTRWPDTGEDLATYLILILPYIEMASDTGRIHLVRFLANTFPLALAMERQGDPNIMADRWTLLPAATADLLRRWMRREISVIG